MDRGLRILACSAGLAACQSPDADAPSNPPIASADTAPSAPAFTLVGTPALTIPDDARAFGVRELSVRTSAPTTLTLHLSDPCRARTVRFPTPTTDHRVDVRGLQLGGANHLTIELTDADGGARVLELGTITPGLPDDLPELDVRAHVPEAAAPGLLVLAPLSNQGVSWVLALDECLQPVHALAMGFEDLRLHDGQWLGLRDGQGVLLDIHGRDRVTLGLPNGGLNHELYPLDDGDFLVLDREVRGVPDYPRDETGSTTGWSLVESQQVVRYAPDRTVIERFSLFDLLPTSVVGYKSVEANDVVAKDWTHANALIPYGDDAYLVSVRHLDVVLCLGRDGAVRWLLGDPVGWPAPYDELFLTPVGDLVWPRYQHALELQPDGETLVLFDNQNFSGSPRNPGPDDVLLASRGVAFRIDEAARTVEQRWARTHDDLFTYAMGDADVLGETGLVQLVFSRVAEPKVHTRLVQLPIDGGPAVLDLAVGLDVPRWTYRATVVPSLYGPEATEERVAYGR